MIATLFLFSVAFGMGLAAALVILGGPWVTIFGVIVAASQAVGALSAAMTNPRYKA